MYTRIHKCRRKFSLYINMLYLHMKKYLHIGFQWPFNLSVLIKLDPQLRPMPSRREITFLGTLGANGREPFGVGGDI